MEFDGTQQLLKKGEHYETYLYHGSEYKVFKDYYPLMAIHEEFYTQKSIYVAGLSPVQFYETDDKFVLKMDHVEGEPLSELAKRDAPKAFDIMAQVFRKFHQVIHWQRPLYSLEPKVMYDDLKFVRSSLSRYRNQYKECFCHLNLDLSSVLVTPDGDDFIVINCEKSRLGDPFVDYVRTYMLIEQSSKEYLEIYMERVLPDMWEIGITEEQFENAKKAFQIIDDYKEKYDYIYFGYKVKLYPAIEQLGFEITPGFDNRDQVKVFYDGQPSKEIIKELLLLLTYEQELSFWDEDYGNNIHDPGRYISVYNMGTHVVYHFGNHGWSSGYEKMSLDDMADLIAKNWTRADGRSAYNYDRFVLIKANLNADYDKKAWFDKL